MSTSVAHGSFTVERHYAAAPPQVFRAWSDPEQITAWAAPSPGWSFAIRSFDFRVGGGDLQEFGPPGEVPFTIVSRFDDIIPDQRIIAAYAVARGETRISSSVTCIEFLPDGGGTLLRITEHGAFLDGHDTALGRRGGVEMQVGQLAVHLEGLRAA